MFFIFVFFLFSVLTSYCSPLKKLQRWSFEYLNTGFVCLCNIDASKWVMWISYGTFFYSKNAQTIYTPSRRLCTTWRIHFSLSEWGGRPPSIPVTTLVSGVSLSETPYQVTVLLSPSLWGQRRQPWKSIFSAAALGHQ